MTEPVVIGTATREMLAMLIFVLHEYGHPPSLKDLKRLHEVMTGEPYLHGAGLPEVCEEPE
jgi:hypothetical protein